MNLHWTLFVALSLGTPWASAQAPLPSPKPNINEEKAPIGSIQNWKEKSSAIRLDLKVEKFTLDNGLTVLLHQDRSTPLVSYHTWYRVGSKDEKLGVTGAAHMLEHMMFKGAQKYTDKEFDRILHANGIVNNAFTTQDYTGFYENLPSSKLELIMDVEVDRMAHLALKPDFLKSEKEVVKEERRMRTDNNPMGLLWESMMGTVFRVSNYRWPVIGYMKDIAAYDADKLRYFYESFYGPNNAVLVLAGDIDISQTKKWIQKYYGPLPRRNLPQRQNPTEPRQQAPREVTLEKDVEGATVFVSFPTVGAAAEETFALDLLGAVVGNGSSSRLHRRLVYQKQIAQQAGAYNMSLQDSGVMNFYAGLKPGQDPQKAVDVIINEIWKVRDKEVSEVELNKTKTLVMKEYVDNLRTIDGKARALAVNEILFGDYRKMQTDLEGYNRVQAKDLLNVAQKYLQPNSRSVITLKPTKQP